MVTVPFTELPQEVKLALCFSPKRTVHDNKEYTQLLPADGDKPAMYDVDEHKYLTTGQVAKMCGVSNQTVWKWVDKGMLTCFRVPNSNHRRFTTKDVEEFIKKHGIKLG